MLTTIIVPQSINGFLVQYHPRYWRFSGKKARQGKDSILMKLIVTFDYKFAGGSLVE